MRRIAMISEHASPLAALGGVDSGGQNVYVAQVARHLEDHGYAVDVFTRRDDPDLPEVVCQDNVRVYHVSAGPARKVRKEDLLPFMGEFTDHVLRHCRGEGDYDLIHANFFMSALVAADVKRELGISFVVTFHALGRVRRLFQREADAFPPERIEIEERVVREADRIIAECPQDVEDLVHLYGADRRRMRTIPCGFDPQEFGPINKRAARLKLRLDLDAPLVLQLGRMVPRKGVDNVIRGLAVLRREHGVPAQLMVVGGESRDPDPTQTPEIGRLQQIAEQEKVGDAVHFIGSRGRTELRDFYGAADVFVTTPWYEPFGITPVEAMACGKPVIGADVGGVKFTVQDGVTGFLIPPRDPQALGERLSRLFRDPGLLDAMGKRAMVRANQLFTWERVTRLIARLYRDVREPARTTRAQALTVGGS